MARSTGSGNDVPGDATEELTRALRRWRPAKVRVTVEGEQRDVAVPGSKRHRWETVARLVMSLDWTRVELLDPKGALLHFVEAEVAPPDEEPAGADILDVDKAIGAAPAGMDREHTLIALVLKAQQVVLANQAATLATVVASHQEMLRTAWTRLEHLEATFGRTLQMAHDAAQRVAQTDASGADPNDAAMVGLIEKVMSGRGDAKRLGRLLDRAEKFFGPEEKPKHTVTQQAPNGARE